MHLCVCMRMRMCVFEGVCLYLSVTVYTLSAWGHLDCVCVVLTGESAHMCLREDLVLCGCVFDKLWEHVGDCLSIHLGESKKERAEWGGGRDLLPASIFKSICSQSHKPLYLSLGPEGRRQAERKREIHETQKIYMVKRRKNTEIQSDSLKTIFLFKSIKVIKFVLFQ